MAVIQISKVQVRRGQTAQTGFPQLSSGEFGWSIDQQQLYIGNGAVSEGAPAVGNTRILTERDTNFFLLSSQNYTYSNRPNPDSPVYITGPNSNPYIARTIQDKLDDYINLKDFGAIGDGVTDDTGAIQRAVTHSASTKKVMTFPEGTYLITGTVFIPPYAELRGAGGNKTVIKNAGTQTMFRTVGFTSTGSITTNLSSAAFTPRNISIQGITFSSTFTNAGSILRLVGLTDSTVRDCIFVGNIGILSTSTQASGISLDGDGAIVCNNISIQKNIFQNLSSAIKSDTDATSIEITANKFKDLDLGIEFAKNLTNQPGSQLGPDRVGIYHNEFNNINSQALYSETNLQGQAIIRSANNFYHLAGIGYNNINGDITQSSEVLYFGNFGSASSGDDFSRARTLNSNTLTSFDTVLPVVYGPAVVDSVVDTAKSITVGSNNNVFVWPRSLYTITPGIGSPITCPGQKITLNYVYNSSGIVRRGVLEIGVNGSVPTITDNFSYTGLTDGGLVFSVDLTRSDAILVKASSATAGTLVYNTTVRQ